MNLGFLSEVIYAGDLVI